MRRRANEIGTASNSAEKKGSPSEGVAEGGGWGEEFRHARAEVKRFRRLALSQTSKQNNFQFLLRKIWRAGDKKLKENCFALLAEVRRAETRSGIIRAVFAQNRFELRSAIATMKFVEKQIETFNEKERDILNLCQEIIIWGTKPENARIPEATDLKQSATNLYESFSNTSRSDYQNYYKLFSEFKVLKRKFNEVLNNKGSKYTEELILENIKADLDLKKDIKFGKEWDTDQEAYGDYIDIYLKHSNEKIKLEIIEMVDTYFYENNLIEKIKDIFEKLGLEYDLKEKKHDNGSLEYSLKYESKQKETIEEIIKQLIIVTGNTERILKN